MKKLMKNPFTLWIALTVLALIQEWRCRDRKISIGYMSRVTNCDLGLRVTFGDHVLAFNAQLDDFTYVADGTTIGQARIGKFCSIGPECKIGLGQHPASVFVSTHPAFFSPDPRNQITFADRAYFNEHGPIVIGNDVWLGARAMIMDGVTIGDGAIVAAGAVVTRDVAPFTMVGGVPARRIGERFTPEQAAMIRARQWWNLPLEILQAEFRRLHDLEAFSGLPTGSSK